MVFESLVVDLINRFLGDYVENLDSSQLKLGIWGGDAVLKNLDLKESALDDLDLPVKIKSGHIGNLTLKIPWKNLYTEPVVASIDGIYALALPNIGIKYNAEKEEKAKQDAKQKKLKQIDEAKKLELEKNNPQEPKKDSFAEKLASQVIKNLQIEIKNIHVRYEDRFTNPKNPFAIGITLQELQFQTTDESWKPCVIKEAVDHIFKLVKLESLGVYWNCNAPQYGELERSHILEKLKGCIPTVEEPSDYQFLIKPISSAAHLKLNMKPEKDKFSVPKLFLSVVLDEIAMGLSKRQYNDVLEVLESFERMALLSIYRKYRPNVPLHKNASKWWHYAYTSVLEETVRRRRRMFSWSHIIQYRTLMKRYKEAYVKKLDKKKVSSDVQKTLDDGEKILDVFCITLMRQQAEVEAAKLGAQREQDKKNAGWFGGWFGGGKKKESEEKKKDDIQAQFYESFTAEEKDKLYSAIGYQENEGDLSLPKDFVAVKLVAKLNNLSVTLKDESKKEQQLLKLFLKDLTAKVGQRPAANAVKVEAKLERLTVAGAPQSGFTPQLVKSQIKKDAQVLSLLDLQFETNPIDGTCDTRVGVKARPLEIAFDAITVNQLGDFFKPPESVRLKQLSNVAMARFEEVKQQSTAGLQHTIEQRKYTELNISLESSYVIVPHGGVYKSDAKFLVLDLGSVTVSSEKNQINFLDAKSKTSVDELRKLAYDNINVGVENIQLLFVHPGENWHNARTQGKTSMHILHPISINILIQKCMFDKDPNLAKMKVQGELPLLGINMSDFRLQEILTLVQSIPLPESTEEEPEDDLFKGPSTLPSIDVGASSDAIINKTKVVAGEMKEVEKGTKPLVRSQSAEFVNSIDMQLTFELKEINISLMQRMGNVDVPVLNFQVTSIGTELQMRTMDMFVQAYVGGIYLQHQKLKDSDIEALAAGQQLSDDAALNVGPIVNILNTPVSASTDTISRLLTVDYIKAKPEGPEFSSTYQNREQDIKVNFTALELILHQSAIISILEYVQKLQPPPPAKAAQVAIKASVESKKEEEKEEKEKKPPRKRKVKPKDPNIVDIHVDAHLQGIYVGVCTDEKCISEIRVNGIEADVAVQQAKTAVSVLLKDMTIVDPTEGALYPKIVAIEGSEVLKLDFVQYNNGTEGEKAGDMSCMDMSVDVAIGCIRVTFLNKFVNELLGFLDNFQAAKDKIKEAGEAVAEASAEAVQNIQETASRLGLKVNLKAPLIIVPQSSVSTNVLLTDLGHLEIANTFQLGGKLSSNGIPAVLDKMKIVLTDLKVARGITNNQSTEIVADVLLLEPVTISLDIIRNLSAGWFHDVPEIDVSGTLEAISAKMSQGDFTVIMKMLNENLTEGQKPPKPAIEAPPPTPDKLQLTKKTDSQKSTPAKKTASQTSTPSKKTVSQTSSPDKKTASKTSTPSKDTPAASSVTAVAATEVYQKMKLRFTLKSLSASLYFGDSNLTSGRAERVAAKALGRFELQLFSVEADMMSDNSMTAKVLLRNTILDDLRPAQQNGITRMIERAERKGVENSNMIDVSFDQNSKLDKNIDVSVNCLYICVYLEFLMTLADFFSKGMPQAPEQKALPSTASQTSAPEKKTLPPPPEQPTSEMIIKFSMVQPEIILIEDQSTPSTNAFILNTEIDFKMMTTPEFQQMSATVKDIQLLSCKYNKRDATRAQIINPCEISFHSTAPFGKDHHMDLQMTDLVINVSPGTIRTLSAILSGMTPQKTDEDKAKAAVPSNLWGVKKLSDCDFWFLKTPENTQIKPRMDEADTKDLAVNGDNDVIPRGEQLIVKIPIICLKLEGGVGKRTLPLILLESSFQGEVKDWSSKLVVDSTLSVEIAYYNEKLAVWEPLLEPVLEDGKRRKWELGLEVTQNDDLPPLPEDDTETENIVLPPPKMSICIKSQDSLQLVVTKTCLDVFNNLGKAFGDAYRLVEPTEKPGETLAPYIIQNDTGMEILLKLDNIFENEYDIETEDGEMPRDAESGRVKLGVNRKLQLYKRKGPALVRKASIIKATQESEEMSIIFQIEQFQATRSVTIKRAEKRLFQINQKTYQGDMWAVICSVESSIGQKTVSLRSIVDIKNHLSIPMEVFYQGDTKTMPIGIVDPGQNISVPLAAVYATTPKLFFKPYGLSYDMSKEGVEWKATENNPSTEISCGSLDGSSPYYVNIVPKIEDVYFDTGDELTAQCYTLNLHPTVFVHNLLPFPIKLLLEGTADELNLKKGENTALQNASIDKSNLEIIIPEYQGKQWTGRRCIQKNVPELSIWTFESFEGSEKITMDLGLHCTSTRGSMDISLYSPYWMINKTGQNLTYRGSDADITVDHPGDCEDIMLFSFKQKGLFGIKKKEKETKEPDKKGTLERKGGKVKEMKQSGKVAKVEETEQLSGEQKEAEPAKKVPKSTKAQLKINETDWSDKFSLDVVGSSGTVQCKTKKSSLEVGVKIILSNAGLTKIVTFTPYYMLMNKSEHAILCTEPEVDSWVEVQPEECKPFWPTQSGKDVKLKAKYKDTDIVTQPFLINKAHTTLLKLDSPNGGINTECQVTESAVVTKLFDYVDGMAPVLLVNHLKSFTVQYQQSGLKETHSLGPLESTLYTWEDALGKRDLQWTCGSKKNVSNSLIEDGIAEFSPESDSKVYWVSFLDGLQRVLMFTEDLALATLAQEAGELERIDQEILLNIQGMGLSLVNNYTQTEIAYMGITSSGVIWEEKKKRFKAVNVKNCAILEAAYQSYIQDLAAGKSPNSHMILENKLEVDFKDMRMIKPNKRVIKRSFEDGIWIQYKTSPHQLQLHAKINRLQLDNQLIGAVFPTVLSPIPPPKSVAAESVPKPFTELSLIQRKHEHSHMTQVKYCMVLMQEMSLQVDQGFLNAILQLFASDTPVSREQETIGFGEDCTETKKPLVEVAGVSAAEGQKNFYDHLHFSPIKVHLSFSLQGGASGDDDKPTQLHSDVINVFLQSVGVVLTDVQDVVFKLGYFERKHKFYNNPQLTGELTTHYASQALKQMYVLVLGLDVLGNPFGLLRGLSEGVEDLFYEPYQGLIQGPEEFAEGLALGVRSLFGHAVGGAAGAVGRITGTLGKGLAALTLDDDYQKKRREQLNKKPASAKEGFARGGKGLVMGVFDGVTGIVRKPIEGAKKEGAQGFFKGVGKGLVGAVTRPTSGVVDFASSSLEGIRRIADTTEEIHRLRPPRRFHNDRIIRPYKLQEAEGFAVLGETQKGKYAATDEYLAHVVVSKDGKHIFMVTDKRIFLVVRGELFGQWDCDWAYTWVELKECPKKTNKGIEIILKEKEKKKLFGSSGLKKEVAITDPKIREWVAEKIAEAFTR